MGDDKESREDAGRKQMMQVPPPYGWYPPEEDEIDLADLVGVFFRRKGFIAVLTILFACLALGAGLMATEKYEAMSIIEIGQIQPENEYRHIESPSASAERLRGIAKRVYSSPPFDDDAAFSIKDDLGISPSKEGGIVELTLEAPRNSRAIEFLTSLNQGLIADHGRIINIERQKLKTHIDNLQSKAAEYQGRKTSYQKRLENLKEEERFLQEQIKSANQQIEQILTIKARASLESENEPLGQLLFSNEMHRIQAHKDQLSTRLMSGIPEERENLTMQIQGAESEIQTIKNNLEMMQVRMDNIISTRVLLKPRLSKNPIFPNQKLNVALGLIGGFFISIFLAFIIEFWQKNKEKIKAGDK